MSISFGSKGRRCLAIDCGLFGLYIKPLRVTALWGQDMDRFVSFGLEWGSTAEVEG